MCGNVSCMETVVSASRSNGSRRSISPGTPINQLFARHMDSCVMQDFLEGMGQAVAAEANLFDPDCVILGGGLLQMEGFPRGALEEAVHRYARKPYPERDARPPLFASQPGQRPGRRGHLRRKAAGGPQLPVNETKQPGRRGFARARACDFRMEELAMKLAIGNDHVAVEMKREIKAYLEEKGIEVVDVGTNSTERFNYPVSGYKVAKLVAAGEVDGGVLICGTGVGISLAANKVKGIRSLRVQRALFGQALQAAQQYQHHRLRRSGHRRRDREDDRGRVGWAPPMRAAAIRSGWT